MGVPQSNMTLLLDKKASLKAIRTALKKAVGMTAEDETLVFYYAGHGMRLKKEVFFINYDANTSKAEETAFSLSELENTCTKLKGHILLMADCCYSGELSSVSRKLGTKGVKAASASSAEASNESTENWTFTQTLIDALKGSSMSDHNKDGKIDLKELNLEVKEAMRHREKQRSANSYDGITGDYVLCHKTLKEDFNEIPSWATQKFKRGTYVMAENVSNEPPQCGRVIGGDSEKLLIRFYNYNKALDKPVTKSKIALSTFETFPEKSEVKVLQKCKEWDAIVIESSDGFHLVTYPGWGEEWNEWLMSDRIICLKEEEQNRRKCQVKWHDNWYGAEVYRSRNKMYRIHYDGHSSNWDEWVGESRIRFNNDLQTFQQ
jgi:hypothetical protein